MSYEPTEWRTGDIISSEKLNKLEEGVASASSGGGIYYVNVVGGSTLDKNFSEINSAYRRGEYPIIVVYGEDGGLFEASLMPVIAIANAGGYMVMCYDLVHSASMAFTADTETGTLTLIAQ